MSDRIKPAAFGEFPIDNCEIGADDIDWCTGFWNELDGEIIPSLYPDSPIFSSTEFDWDDPVFLENVFFSPDIEDTFAGTHPVSLENPFDTKTNEGIYSYSSSNDCESDSVLQVRPPANASKEKYKRPKKPKTENAEATPSKRQRTSSTKKTKPKAKK